MSVSTPTKPIRGAKPVAVCAFVLLIVLVTSACVNLEEPWKQARVVAGTGGDMPPLATGGKAGSMIELDSGSGDLTTSSVGGAGDPRDGALPSTDAPQDRAAFESEAGGQGGLMGTGGKAQGGAGGSDGGSVLGTGGSVSRDAAKPDTSPTRADAAADVPSDTRSDPRDEAADVGADGVSTAGLLVYYACEGPGGASGTTLVDLSGNDNHGTLSVGPGPTGGASGAGGRAASQAWSFEPGKVDNGLALHGEQYGYVALPQGLLAGQKEATFSAWVKLNDTEAFQRVFDFSTDTNNFMYLATANSQNTGIRFRIANTAGTDAGTSQVLESSRPLPDATWIHLALVLGNSGASIYVNGSRQARSSDITLRPVDLGITTNNFIGRSIFPADPYLDATIDEYRIYNRALSREEILALAGR